MHRHYNEKRYSFSDFTLSEYRGLLRLANEAHIFRGYNDFQRDENFVLWRHDIDFSPSRAVRLAKIEREEKVSSTYFVLLHSEFYNPLEGSVRDILLQILDLGHEVGLHFDFSFYRYNKKRLDQALSVESQLLEMTLETQIRSFSFHNPTEVELSLNGDSYAGLVNCYSPYFFKDVDYVSDSNGYWRHRSIRQALQVSKDRPIQVLTHPVWWASGVDSPKCKVDSCIDSRAVSNKQFYADLLRAGGRENVDW
jgi:hypothetical protein